MNQNKISLNPLSFQFPTVIEFDLDSISLEDNNDKDMGLISLEKYKEKNELGKIVIK